jgi:cytochrome b561
LVEAKRPLAEVLVTAVKYGRIAQLLHWAMAMLMIPMLLLGEQTMGGHNARFLPTVHASLGLALGVLVVFRLVWRWKFLAPPALKSSGWQLYISTWAHRFLYLAMFAIPLSGWLAYTEHVRRSLGMRPASWFGFRIPLLPDFGVNWHLIHNWGGKLVLLLIVIHAATALKHHFYDGDDTLKRILP